MGKSKLDIRLDSICIISSIILVIVALLVDNLFLELVCIVDAIILTNLISTNISKKKD